MFLNTCSIKKGGVIDVVHKFADCNRIDILCFAETWLTQSVTDAELSSNGKFNVFRRDRATRGGGVLTLTRKHLQCTQSNVAMRSEMMCVDVLCGRSVFRLVTAYSAGTSSADDNLAQMDTMIGELNGLCEIDIP